MVRYVYITLGVLVQLPGIVLYALHRVVDALLVHIGWRGPRI